MSDEESYIINRLHERFGGGMDKEHFTFLFYFISLMASLTALIITIKFIQ